MLRGLSAEDQAGIVCESRVGDDDQRFMVHLPDRTLVYHGSASIKSGRRVWTILASGVQAAKAYRGRNGVLTQGQWMVADSDGNIGTVDHRIPSHFGEVTGWRFDSIALFNEAGRGIVQSVTLAGLPGRAAGPIGPYGDSVMREVTDGSLRVSDQAGPDYRVVSRGTLGRYGVDPVAFLSYTTDGVTYGQEYGAFTGRKGQRDKRIQWRRPRRFDSWLGMRFRGADDGMAAFARMDVVVEALGQ
jgi:hypothetical protein